MTQAEINTERAYRIQERLGILSQGGVVTSAMREIAEREAKEWERKQVADEDVEQMMKGD